MAPASWLVAVLCTVPVLSEELPKWNLKDLFGFDSPKDELISDYIDEAEALAKALHQFKGQVHKWPAEMLETYDKLMTVVAHPKHYLSLLSSTNPDDASVSATMSKMLPRIDHIQRDLLSFIDRELLEVDWRAAGHHYARTNETLLTKWRFYTPYVNGLHDRKAHIFSEELENFLAARSIWIGKAGAGEYHLQAVTSLQVDWTDPVSNETSKMTTTSLTQCQSRPDWRVRASCLETSNQLLRDKLALEGAAALNQIAGDWIINSMQRHYAVEENVRAQRYTQNRMSRKSVEAMLKVLKELSPKLTRRFYHMKKRLLLAEDKSMTELKWSDRVAELTLSGDERKLSWQDGTSMVRKAFQEFDESLGSDSFEYKALFDRFLEEERYQVAERALGGGSLCTATSPDVGPLISLEWTGLLSQVFTIAHETGHAIQFEYTSQLGSLYYDLGLGVSETASLFAEQIFGNYLSGQQSSDTKEKKLQSLGVLMHRLDALINTLLRQAQFDNFEEGVYRARISGGPLSLDTVVSTWRQSLQDFYADSFDNYENSEYFWCRISHFYETPFYVYNYAWAQMIAGFVFANRHHQQFVNVWRAILTWADITSPQELLKPLNVNLEDESFWRNAIDVTVTQLLDEAEGLTQSLGF